MSIRILETDFDQTCERGNRGQLRGSIREAVGRVYPEAAARGRISVRDSLIAALLTMQHADRTPGSRFETDRLLESCDLHYDLLDEQPDEYLGLLHDVLCSK
jgi:hypothetical protein